MELQTDGEGFLINRDDWSEEVARELARNDEFEVDEQIMNFILQARQMYETDGVVPPIRKFAKTNKISTKELYEIFKKGPMKLICKWGGLPEAYRLRLILEYFIYSLCSGIRMKHLHSCRTSEWHQSFPA